MDRPVCNSCLCPAGAQATEFAAWAPILMADQYRMRGTFLRHDRLLTAKNTYNPLDGRSRNPGRQCPGHFCYGIDATDGTETVNYGNDYGVIYQLRLPTANSICSPVFESLKAVNMQGFYCPQPEKIS